MALVASLPSLLASPSPPSPPSPPRRLRRSWLLASSCGRADGSRPILPARPSPPSQLSPPATASAAGVLWWSLRPPVRPARSLTLLHVSPLPCSGVVHGAERPRSLILSPPRVHRSSGGASPSGCRWRHSGAAQGCTNPASTFHQGPFQNEVNARWCGLLQPDFDGAPRGSVGGLLAVSAHGSGGPASLDV
jgi:hypothetical protein